MASGKMEIPTKETIMWRNYLSSSDVPPLLATQWYNENEGFYNWLLQHPDILNGTSEEIDAAKLKYDAIRAKKKKRNKKRRERAKRNKKKKKMFGTCGWWRLREDHPLQLIANEFATIHQMHRFPLHITYSYGDDDFNQHFNEQYTTTPWFNPMDMKYKICDPPDDRWEWYTVKEDDDFIINFDLNFYEKENCLFHKIKIPIFLYDKYEMEPEPRHNGPEFYKYYMSLAYGVVDLSESHNNANPYGLITRNDDYLQWFHETLNNKKIIFKNEDFTPELWNCSSTKIEEWHKL